VCKQIKPTDNDLTVTFVPVGADGYIYTPDRIRMTILPSAKEVANNPTISWSVLIPIMNGAQQDQVFQNSRSNVHSVEIDMNVFTTLSSPAGSLIPSKGDIEQTGLKVQVIVSSEGILKAETYELKFRKPSAPGSLSFAQSESNIELPYFDGMDITVNAEKDGYVWVEYFDEFEGDFYPITPKINMTINVDLFENVKIPLT
jgi:hypothetical protein